MKRSRKICLLLLCMISMRAWTAGAADNGVKQVWKMRIADLNSRAKGKNPADILVFGLGFSPDGARIVAVVGPSRRDQSIIILDASDPRKNVLQLNTNPAFWEFDFPSQTRSILWSDDGQILILNKTMIQLPGGSVCTLPDGLFRFSFAALYRALDSGFRFFNWNCNDAPGDARLKYLILDANEDRALLCISPQSGKPEPVDIVDAASLKPLMRVPVSREPFPNIARFSERGKVVCGTNGTLWNQHAACWEIDTGKEIARSRTYSRLDILPSRCSSSILMSEYARKYDFIDMRWALGSLHRRIVWDYRKGREWVLGPIKFQQEEMRWENGDRRIMKFAYRIALSPDGKYVAEGGMGELILRKIEF